MGEDLALALALEGKVSARGETAGLVALASTLAALPEPEIDAAFADALEQQLLTDGLPVGRPQLTLVRPAEKTSVEQTTPRAPVVRMPRRRLMVRRSVAGMAAAASLMAFPLVAAAQSLPGSPFYGLKQRIHSIQLAVFGTPVEDGFRLMNWADEDVADAQQLASSPRPDQDLITRTLEKATAEMNKAQSLIIGNTTSTADLQKLAAMARDTAGQIGSIAGLSTEGRAALKQALAATASIQRAVSAALGLPISTVIDSSSIVTKPAGGATMAGTPEMTDTTTATRTKEQKSSDDPLPKDDRTPKEVKDARETGCQQIGGAQLSGDFDPIYDPLCSNPTGSI